MRVLATIFTTLLLTTAAWAYNPVSSEVRTLSSDPETKEVIFQVRNSGLLPMTGYYYEIRLFDQEERRVLTPHGEVFQGYQSLRLPPEGIGEGRVRLSPVMAQAVRAEVTLILVCTMSGGEVHRF